MSTISEGPQPIEKHLSLNSLPTQSNEHLKEKNRFSKKEESRDVLSVSKSPRTRDSESSGSSLKKQAQDLIKVWKIYIRTLQQLKKIPDEYAKVPEILKNLNDQEIDNLTTYDIQALQAMNALPQYEITPLSDKEMHVYQTYLKMIYKQLKNKNKENNVPAILKLFTEEEISRLNSAQVQALKLMELFPASLSDDKNSNSDALDKALKELFKGDRELQKLAGNPSKWGELAYHPKIVNLLKSKPQLQEILDKELQRQVENYLKTCFPSSDIARPPGKKNEHQPYSAFPQAGLNHDAPCAANPFDLLGKSIGRELEWLIGL